MVRSEAQARTLIARFAEADQEPSLTADEIEGLVEQARRVNNTWDINAAVARGWALKAERAEGETRERCLRQVERWQARVRESVLPATVAIKRRKGAR